MFAVRSDGGGIGAAAVSLSSRQLLWDVTQSYSADMPGGHGPSCFSSIPSQLEGRVCCGSQGRM